MQGGPRSRYARANQQENYNMIDLRSDTVTRPGPAMRVAMAESEVGDDVMGEDPSVNRLEETAAEMVGHEAAVLATSGTQGNLLGMLAHCERGDEYVTGQEAHTFKYEGGGAAVLGSIQPQPIEFEADGTLSLDRVAKVLKPADDDHFARTRLLCLENTRSGKVLPLDYLAEAREFTHEHGLGLHLDGARVFNAAVKLNVDVREITRHVDSVSFCLSKGLGAPVGSLLCGPAELVRKARRWRKVLGGGMRQAGVFAAAGQVALEQNVARLCEDHANAARLAAGLMEVGGLSIDAEAVQTNMVFVHVAPDRLRPFIDFMLERDVRLSERNPMRMVTHLDVSAEDIEHVIAGAREFFARNAA